MNENYVDWTKEDLIREIKKPKKSKVSLFTHTESIAPGCFMEKSMSLNFVTLLPDSADRYFSTALFK